MYRTKVYKSGEHARKFEKNSDDFISRYLGKYRKHKSIGGAVSIESPIDDFILTRFSASSLLFDAEFT